MEVSPGMIPARDSMQTARAELLNNLETFVSHIETFPDGPAKSVLCDIALNVIQWGKSMGGAIEGLNELMAKIESAPSDLFPPGMDAITDPKRRVN